MSMRVRRLYNNFKPDNYNLDLTINPDSMRFEGKVIIDGYKVGRPSKRLTFHQKALKIKKVKVLSLNSKDALPLKIVRIVNHKNFDELRIHFNELIYPGRFKIEIEYSGQINSALHGIYASKFKNSNLENVIICTQFESHYAREALVCIDEPEAKAIFNLTLRTPKSLPTVISNSQVKTTTLEGDIRVSQFEPSPKMSSYLLAFVIGDLKYLEGRTKNNTIVRTYATPANVAFSKFALECAIKTLEFYDEYFAIVYPLAKCDLIALPDFSSGAMENWGCITFREQAMLVDPKNTSLGLKQHVANVIAHELTHQWFGNLVTMKWWNDLWLNESFASWMSYLAVDNLFPEWKVWTQFTIEEQAVGLKQDSLEHTHPIEVKINNPNEIRTVFDAISYEKGASVITMLHDYLGADNFKIGIRKYLSDHSYSNTITSDLWNALESVAGLQVGQFMNRWVTTSGYPLLKVIYSDNNVHLEQHRFYLNPLAVKDDAIWPIPLFSDLKLGKNDPFAHRSINVSLVDQPSNLIINKNRRGFFRVIYDDLTIKNILKDDLLIKLSDVDRLGLLSDAFEAAKASYLPSLTALNILKAYVNETSVVVWDVIASNLNSIRMVMDDDKLRDLMKPFMRSLISLELKRLGLKAKKTDSHFDKLLRPIILSLASIADEPTVIKEFKRLFYEQKAESIDPDIRGIVYMTIARHGDEKDFETLVNMHNNSTSSEERIKLAAAITGFKQSNILKKAIGLIKSDNVRLQDVMYWVSFIFSNQYSRDMAWQWLKDNWSFLDDNLSEDLSFYRLPFYVARCYSSIEFIKEFEDFFTTHLEPGIDRPLKQAIETIQWQASWKNRDFDSIVSFFKNN